MSHRISTNEKLAIGDHLDAGNGQFNLQMQLDSNLVLYRGTPALSTAYWASGTNWLPPDQRPQSAVMQTDGHFVMYDPAGVPRWGSGTWGPDFKDPFLTLQDDGNLVIYDGTGTAIWASGNPIGQGRLAARGFVRLHTGGGRTIRIDPEEFDLQYGHWMTSQLDMALSRQVSGHTDFTCTNKISGFTGGVRLQYIDAAGVQIGTSQDFSYGVNQAPIIGANHRSVDWYDSAPEGTDIIGMTQFWSPHDRVLDIIDAIDVVMKDIEKGIDFVAHFCDNYPNFCNAVKTVFSKK